MRFEGLEGVNLNLRWHKSDLRDIPRLKSLSFRLLSAFKIVFRVWSGGSFRSLPGGFRTSWGAKPGFDRTGWKTCQESIAIGQPGQNKSLNKELCSML